jgi:uncharacterized protein YprB with RNaseH-like and TPR domain
MIFLDIETSEFEPGKCKLSSLTIESILAWQVRLHEHTPSERFFSTPRKAEGGERGLIEELVKWLHDLQDKIVVGFNILKFDIPVLLLRCSELCPNLLDDFFSMLNRCNTIDLLVIETYRRKGKVVSLRDACKEYGIKEPMERPKRPDEEQLFKYQESELGALVKLFYKIYPLQLRN